MSILNSVAEVIAQLLERPEDAELYQLLGDLHFEQRELSQAWEAYMQALRLNPNDPWTCLKFGTLLAISEECRTNARELFDRAVELAPDLPAVHWCSGNLYRKQGQYDLAEQAYLRAVEVNTDDKQAQDKLSEWRLFAADLRIVTSQATSEGEHRVNGA